MGPRNLFEAHLNVSDLERSIAYYRDIVGLKEAHFDSERRAAFFWIGRSQSMLGLWEAGDGPNSMRLHIACGVTLEEVLSTPERLRTSGVTPLDFFCRPTTEPCVIGWMPAASVYFRDPDGHLLEYVAMLAEAPRVEAGIVPYSEWVAVWAAAAL